MERKRGRADDQCAGRDYSEEVDYQYALQTGINYGDESAQTAHIDSLFCTEPSPLADVVGADVAIAGQGQGHVEVDFGGGRVDSRRSTRGRNDSGVKKDRRRRPR